MKREILSLELFGDRLNADPYPKGDGGEHERLLLTLERAASGELTPRQRKCLRLMYTEGMSVCEIADALGVRPSTVSKHLKKSRERLKKILGYSFPRLEEKIPHQNQRAGEPDF